MENPHSVLSVIAGSYGTEIVNVAGVPGVSVTVVVPW